MTETPANAPLSLRSARLAQAGWAIVALAGVSLNAVTNASGWKTLDTVCHAGVTCTGSQIDISAARTLSHYGMSIHVFAWYSTLIIAANLCLFYGLGALVMWRKPTDRGAVLTAFFLALFPTLVTFSNTPPPLVIGTLVLFGLLFPDGRFAPTWTRWLALAVVLACISGILFEGLATLATITLLVPVPVLQVYRYRRMSSWAERQRTKWALFGLVVAIVGFMAVIITFVLKLWQTSNGSLYSGLFSPTAFSIAISAIPLSLAVSVLRSNLWDIDRVISRTLAYASLSLLLAGVYIAGVLGFQRLFQVFARHSSTIAVALSTLVIAALFGPLRHRIQTAIDRRFYRAKYDGARAVAAFAQGLRDEVDLAQISHDMTVLVRETLQPEHVSLWLRDEDRSKVRRSPRQ